MTVKIIGEKYKSSVKKLVQDEAEIHIEATRSQPPYVLGCYGYSTRQNHPPFLGYIYMKYAPFGDLFNLLDRIQREPE